MKFFLDFETGISPEARFAHSIDKISSNLSELVLDEQLARERHSHFGFEIVQGVEKDRDKMQWNEFLTNFYDELIEQIKDRFER